QNTGLWLIDNVHIDAGNAKFKTWNGTAWSGDTTERPSSREKAIFSGNYSFSGLNEAGDLSVCECEVSASSTLTVPANKTLAVRNRMINNGSGSNVILESDANLIQTENNVLNVGEITAKRNLTFRNNERKEYNYLISPVEGVNLKTGIYKTNAMDSVTSPSVLYHSEAANYFSNSSGAYIKGRA